MFAGEGTVAGSGGRDSLGNDEALVLVSLGGSTWTLLTY